MSVPTSTDRATPRLRRILAQSAAGTTVARGLGAAGGVAAARLLTPASRGDLALLVVIASIGSLAGATGLQFWIAREVAGTGSLMSPTQVAIRHSLATVAVFTLGASLLAPVLVSRFIGASDYLATVAYALTGAVAFSALALPNGARAMGTVAAALTVGSAIYLGGTLALLGFGHPSVAAVLWFATIGNLATLLVVVRFVRSHSNEPISMGPPSARSEWSRGLRYGLPGGLGELVLLGMLRVDFLLVGAFLPLASVAVYAVATALTELLWVIPDATAQVVLPTAADHETASACAPVFRIAMCATLVGGVALCAVARPLLTGVFGTAYARGASIIPYLTIAAIAGGAWKVIAADVAARVGTRPRLFSAVGGLVTMVLADMFLIPADGLQGAAIGAAGGYGVALAMVVWEWRRANHASGLDLVGLRASDFDLFHHTPALASEVEVDA